MNEEAEFSLNEIGRCSITSVLSAYEHFFKQSLNRNQMKDVETMFTNYFRLFREKDIKVSYSAIAHVIRSLIEVNQSLGLKINKITIDENNKTGLIDSGLLNPDEISLLSTSVAYPPFYVITGNAVSRHGEFIKDINQYNDHVKKMRVRFGDEVQLIMEVRN